ncbi:cell division initiation protein [Mobilisporobacter senegalensis]|uniref:Cell division initiation protein n=1 Tax=Mobilisporobacter senegalensis TaxID=1329262 RepID=A0A3N1XR97_9FIRM|nr:DivIVA domain-containing protein [Mobilisporobacter senegalensis]ROR29155.1 cell division initiation protein [Mobilisporobacter senegalensis]
MLTPIEIQGKVFKSGIGYDKKDVDSFVRELLHNYEVLYKENVELQDKIAILNDGITHYKTIENTLQKALVLAEKAAEETKQTANQKAHSIEKEAHLQANLITAEAKNELNRIHLKTIELVQQYNRYKIQFEKLAETQMELLNSNGFNIDIGNLDVMLEKGIANLNDYSKKESDLVEKMDKAIDENELMEDTVSEKEEPEENKELDGKESKENDFRVDLGADDGFDFLDLED